MLFFSYALRDKYYYWGFYMKENNKFTLRRMIAALGMVLMLSLSLTGMTQPAKALPSKVSAAVSIGVSKTSVTFGNTSASATVTVSGVSTYKATSPYSWIHPTQSGKTVTIRVDAQPYDAVRTGYVVITSGSSERRITVTQYPAMKIYISGDYKNQIVSVTLMGVKNKVDPADARIYVDTYGVLSVKSNNPWISVKLNGGNYFTITAQPNTTRSERRGSVTVSNGFVSRSVTVIQKPLVLSEIYSYPYIGPTSFSLTYGIKNAYKTISESNWNKKSLSDQEELLKGLLPEVIRFYGIYEIYGDIKLVYDTRANIEAKYHKTLRTDDWGLTSGSGDYVYIYLNADALRNNKYSAVTSLLHETRHVYQDYTATYGGTIYQYLCEYNWAHYIPHSEEKAEQYRNQFVEKDAFTYSEKLFAALVNAVK